MHRRAASPRYCLGVEVERTPGTLHIHQGTYIQKALKRFNMENCNTAPTPMDRLPLPNINKEPTADFPYREIVGTLQYLSIATRPDITIAVSQLS